MTCNNCKGPTGRDGYYEPPDESDDVAALRAQNKALADALEQALYILTPEIGGAPKCSSDWKSAEAAARAALKAVGR
jgi:hypothetical protein